MLRKAAAAKLQLWTKRPALPEAARGCRDEDLDVRTFAGDDADGRTQIGIGTDQDEALDIVV